MHARPPAPTRDSASATRTVLGVLFAFTLLRVLEPLLPMDWRTWGFDATRWWVQDAGLPATLAIALIPLAALLRPITHLIAREGIVRRDNRQATRRRTWIPAAAAGTGLLLVAAAWYFPVIFALYGDGSYYQSEILRLLADPGREAAFIKPTAWLSGHAIAGVARLLESIDTRTPYVVIGLLAVVFMTAGVAAALRRATPDGRWPFLVFAAGPGLLFFHAYVEMYALPFAAAMTSLAFLWSAMTMRGSDRDAVSSYPRTALIAAGACAMLAIAFSAVALVLLPPLFMGAVSVGRPRLTRHVLPVLLAAPPLVLAVLLATIGRDPWNPWVLPSVAVDMITPDGINEGSFAYTVFSAAHLADVVNLMLLAGGPALLLLAVLGRRAWRYHDRHPILPVAAVFLSTGVSAVLGGYAWFGLMRDWDAALFPALAVPFAAAATLHVLSRTGTVQPGRILTPLVLVQMSGLVLWIGLHSLPAAADRFERQLHEDAGLIAPQRLYTGWESLRKYRAFTGDVDAEHRAVDASFETGWRRDDALRRMFGDALRAGSADERRRMFSRLYTALGRTLEDNRDARSARYVPTRQLGELTAVALIAGRYAGLGDLAEAALSAFDAPLGAWEQREFVRSVMDHSRGMADKADVALAAVVHASDGMLLATAADHLVAARRYHEAASLYHRALEAEPSEHPVIYLRLARLQEQALGDHAAARRTLELCIERCLIFEGRDEVRARIDELRRRSGN